MEMPINDTPMIYQSSNPIDEKPVIRTQKDSPPGVKLANRNSIRRDSQTSTTPSTPGSSASSAKPRRLRKPASSAAIRSAYTLGEVQMNGDDGPQATAGNTNESKAEPEAPRNTDCQQPASSSSH